MTMVFAWRRLINCCTFLVLFSALLSILLSVLPVRADDYKPLIVSDFSHEGLDYWQQKSFQGNSDYQIVEIDGRRVLRAETRSAASALYKSMEIDLRKTPFLNWSWRVDNTYSLTKPESKSDDDYPARIYVVIKEGFFPWQTKALNYVWCNSKTEKSFWPNPFTASAIMIPVRCGDENLGQWFTERVNIVEDFQRVFHRSIDTAHGVAIMSDSDNAGGSATAYYQGISFSN